MKNKKIKSSIILVSIGLMMFAIVGCSNSKDSSESNTVEETKSIEEVAEIENTEELDETEDSQEAEEIETETTKTYKEIYWPDSELGEMLPQPESLVGEVYLDESDGFVIGIANMTEEQFEAYVKECKNSGFNVDYSKQDGFYYAYNEKGYCLMLFFEEEDENFMTIYLDAPSDSE